MSSYSSQFEEAVFQTVVPQLEAEGFSVFIHPSQKMLPAFLSVFQPDAVAYNGEKKIAIEVMTADVTAKPKTERLQKLFAEHPDWELRLVYAPSQSSEAIPVASKQIIEENLHQIRSSFEAMGSRAALLTAWAVFEATARSVTPTNFTKPQTSARLLETLASEGYITPDEADILRLLSRIRNEVAHGHLDLEPAREAVEKLLDIIQTILNLDVEKI